MAGEVAVLKPKHSVSTLSEELVPSSPGPDGAPPGPVASIPVSMVVHGGTGILHGNMTSLTVNQYIGMVPDRSRGVWDSGMIRELMSDAVKISADANTQLFHPSEPTGRPALSDVRKALTKRVAKRGCWLTMTVLVISSIAILVSTSLYTSFSTASPPTAPRPSPRQPFHETTDIPDEVDLEDTRSPQPENDSDAPRILRRSYWLARPHLGKMTKMVLPVSRVVVGDSETEECTTESACVDQVRNIQRYDMDTDSLQDIAYNFLIGGEGDVYVGRGWDQQGAHTKHFNVAALGVELIGTFKTKAPSEVQIEALSRLINVGVNNYKISPNYTLVTHCQLRQDGHNKGVELARVVSGLPHFDDSYPISRCSD